jgi:hypothetical protein
VFDGVVETGGLTAVEVGPTAEGEFWTAGVDMLGWTAGVEVVEVAAAEPQPVSTKAQTNKITKGTINFFILSPFHRS